MKPSWNDAPEWAQYLAMDSDGTWYWYEQEPVSCDGRFVIIRGNSMRAMGSKNYPVSDWKTTAELRPEFEGMI